MPWGAAAATLLAPLLSKAVGGDTPTNTPSTPTDLQPMRAQQIGLLNYLLGMGPDPRTTSATGHDVTSLRNGLHPKPAPASGTQTLPGMSVYTPQPTQPLPFGPQGGGIGGTTGLLPHLAGGGTLYSSGGAVSGPGTGTSDSVPAQLSNGEGVLTAQTVQALGGPHIIDLLNHLGRQHMAYGGVAGQPSDGLTLNPTPQLSGGQSPSLGAGVQPYTGAPGIISAQPSGPAPSINVGSPNGVEPLSQGSGQGGGQQTPQQRLESFYGPLGVTQSPLQQQGTNAYSQFLNQPSPWDRAANVTNPQLQQNLTGNSSTQGSINGLMGLQTGAGADVTGRLGQISQGGGSQTGSNVMDQVLRSLGQGTTGAQQNLSGLGQGYSTGNPQLQQYLNSLAMGSGANNLAGLGQVQGGAGINPQAAAALGQISQSNPGQGVLDALNPAFQRNLAAADQTGGRFGTSNALGRATATDQYNQLAQQALQQGVTQQTTAAQNLGALGSQADATNMQGAIASAGNQLQGGQYGQNNQLQALQLAQTGNLGQGQLALGANSAIAGQQGNATGQAIGANQGLNQNVIQALQLLGGFNQAGQAQQGQNLTNAGNLGLGQGQLSNNAANIYQQGANNQGNGNLNTVGQAFNAGTTNTNQGYQGQQNTMALLQALLGSAQGASLGGPVQSTPGVGTQMASGLAGLLPLLFGGQGQKPVGNSGAVDNATYTNTGTYS